MASSIIHMVIAKEINKKLGRNEEKLLIGSVAPDISKCLNHSKEESHFIDVKGDNLPNLTNFLNKYQKHLNDDFVLGYYIHLYTDYLWFKYFITEIVDNNDIITKLNGDKIKLNGTMKVMYIYNDYTNLNIQLINKYNLNLDFLDTQNNSFAPIIEEIPYDNLAVLYDAIKDIIKNTKTKKFFVFNLDNVEKFIQTSTQIILSEIEKIL